MFPCLSNIAYMLLYELYNSLLGDLLQRPLWNSHASNNYSYYPVLFLTEEKLKLAQQALNQKDIFPRRYFYPSLDELDFLNEHSEIMHVSRDIARRISLCGSGLHR